MNARTRMILAVVGILVISLIFYFLMIKPRKAELARVEQEITAEVAKTQALTLELARLQDLQERAPKLRLELAEIRRFVPVGHEVPNFIFLVQAASNAAGVDFLTITPSLPAPPEEGAAVAQVEIAINAEGSYFSIQDFIRRLHGLDRALRVDILNLAPGGEETTTTGATGLTAAMTTRIFFQPPAPPPAPAASPAPGGTPAPGATPAEEA